MSKSKIGIGTVEAHKKFDSFEEASKHAKRLRHAIDYICKKNGYQSSVMTVVSNMKKGTSDLRYISSGKRGRPKKELVANPLYKGKCKTDWHIHILIVSNPSYMLRNLIKDYIDKNWGNIPSDKENNSSEEKAYKETCNIKISDYFIDQSSEIRFISCNYSEEKDFDFTLKDYYKEYMKLKSNKQRLTKKNIVKPMNEELYLKQLDKIERPFKDVEDYFYSITEKQDKKDQREYMKKIKFSKISSNCNKVQNISRRHRCEESYY